MILKEKQIVISQDPKVRAGEEAEKQMAFYLQRNFSKSKDIFLLNDLRIVHDNDVAQIDHLVISKFGLFIIESKSVYGKISINKQNEWSRSYNNQTREFGMPSPVLQAEAQSKILREVLIDNKDKLLSKLLGVLQKGFKHCPINIYIAVSDNGIIDRKISIPELFKADQISNAIKEKLNYCKKISSTLSLSMDTGWSISAEETKTVAQFLLRQHQPKVQIKNKADVSMPIETKLQSPTIKPVAEKVFIPKIGATCPKCNQHKLIQKSISRSDGTETDFLACAAYPSDCKAVFALVAVANKASSAESNIEITELRANDTCPKCASGKLVLRKAKTEFFGCSQYPKCKFTSYKNNV